MRLRFAQLTVELPELVRHRSSANRTQEETVSASDRPGVLFRAGTSQSKAVSWIGAAAVCCPVAARALRLEGGEPTVADPAAWR